MSELPATRGDRPSAGEPLPVVFANTLSAARGKLIEGLGSPADLEAWMRRCRRLFPHPLPGDAALRADERQLAHALRLRDATRRLLAARVDREAPDPRDVEQVNHTSLLARPWPVLTWPDAGAPRVEHLCTADPAVYAQAQIARSLVDLLTGEQGPLLRLCRAPGCVLFFRLRHPRQAWCSSGCGNRARVARYGTRHHLGHGE